MIEVLEQVTLTIHPDNDNPFLQGPFKSNDANTRQTPTALP